MRKPILPSANLWRSTPTGTSGGLTVATLIGPLAAYSPNSKENVNSGGWSTGPSGHTATSCFAPNVYNGFQFLNWIGEFPKNFLSQSNFLRRCSYHPRKSHTPANTRHDYFLCCGKPDYRFEIITKQTGCKFKAHKPVLKSKKEQEIFKIYLYMNHLRIMEESSPVQIDSISLKPGDNKVRQNHLVKEEYLPNRGKESKKKKTRKAWLRQHTTSWNQDNQREQEERAMKEIQKFLVSGKDEHKPSPQFHRGSYVNVEAEWWSNLRSKMRNITQEK